MPRKLRFTPGGLAYHVMNRASPGIALFHADGDYQAFERVLAEAVQREPDIRLCDFCLMPNHFHLVLWPKRDAQLSRFMQWLTMTHVQRWHSYRQSVGKGHVYQGRFKSFAIQHDTHFLNVCRYVERNALRARIVDRAEMWQWGSMWVRSHDDSPLIKSLSEWPVAMPADWVRQVNQAQDPAELAALRVATDRGRPYGDAAWTLRTAKRLGNESSMRPAGRPRMKADVEK